MKRILFVSPTFARTGSEVALFNLLTHFHAEGVQSAVATFGNGELLQQLPSGMRSVARTEYKARWTHFPALAWFRLGRIPWDPFLAHVQWSFNPHMWYINTISMPHVVRFVASRNIPCILHWHELDHMLDHLSPEEIEQTVVYPQLIIANSEATRRLIHTLGRSTDVVVSHPALALNRITPTRSPLAERKRLGIPQDALVWLMAGTSGVNKNPFLFVMIANCFLKKEPQANFIWLGPDKPGGFRFYAQRVAQELGISRSVLWLNPPISDYYNVLNAADGLVLTSRQESFSMVAAEANYLGKPVVAFDCGGIREAIGHSGGIIVDQYEASAIAEAMHSVRNAASFDPVRARTYVERFDGRIQVEAWSHAISNCIQRLAG